MDSINFKNLSGKHKFHPCSDNRGVYYCSLCSALYWNSFITIKPLEYNTETYIDPTIVLSNQENILPISRNFQNKKDYIQIRQKVIKEMKTIVKRYKLSYKTLFSAVYYLDKLSSKIYIINEEEIKLISKFCLIIAAKFIEQGDNAFLFEYSLSKNLSSNYKRDEGYILKLLDYDLNVITAYDILITFSQCGFVFDHEIFNLKKLKFIYQNLSKMIYAFIESKNYINLSPFQIALGIIGFSRESLNLEPFTNQLKYIYNLNNGTNDLFNESYFTNILDKIKLCLKFDNKSSIKNNKDEVQKNNKLDNSIEQNNFNTQSNICL